MLASLCLRGALLGCAFLLSAELSLAQSESTVQEAVPNQAQDNFTKKKNNRRIKTEYQHKNQKYYNYEYNYNYTGNSYRTRAHSSSMGNYGYNKPTYAQLGITMKPVEGGVAVSRVTPESGADFAGLKANDQIVAFANIKVTSVNQFIALIQHHKGGESVEISYKRGNQVATTNATLGTMTNTRRRNPNVLPCDRVAAIKGKPFLGIYMENNHNTEQAGVLITSVIPNTGAASSELAAHDRIIGIDGDRMKRYEEVRALIQSHQPGDEIRLEVLREERLLTIPATIGDWGESTQGRKALAIQEERCETYNDPAKACALLDQYNNAPYLGIYMSRNQFDNEGGVLVTSIVGGSAAEQGQLMGGDRIVAMNGTKVTGFESASNFIQAQKPGALITIEYIRGDQKKRTRTRMGSKADRSFNAAHVAYLEEVCENRPIEKEVEVVEPSLEQEQANDFTFERLTPSPLNASVFPNPSNALVNVVYESEATPLTITVTNLEGRVLYNQSIAQFDGQYNQQIDVSKFPPGNYFVNFIQDDGVTSKQLIVQ